MDTLGNNVSELGTDIKELTGGVGNIAENTSNINVGVGSLTAGLNFNLLSLKTGLVGALTSGFETVTGSIGEAAGTISQTMNDLSGSTDVNINIQDLVTCAGANITSEMARLSKTLENLQITMSATGNTENKGFQRIYTDQTDNGIAYKAIEFKMNEDGCETAELFV